MSNLTEIYKKENGYKVLACKISDSGTKRQSIGIYIQAQDDSISEMITIKKSQLLNKNLFDFFIDYEGDFDTADINNIRQIFNETLIRFRLVNCPTKASITDAIKELYNYLKAHKGDKEINIADGYYNIHPKKFKEIICSLNLGYTGLELQRELKIHDYLRTNSNRAYDYAIADVGRVISLKVIDNGGV